MLYDRLSTKLLLKKIKSGIENGESIEYFIDLFKAISTRTNFIGATLNNEYFYRVRLGTNELFSHVDKLRYPPNEFCVKGRLNDVGEQIAYMSLDELGPLTELNINYYQIYCLVKIHHFDKSTIYNYAGVKGNYSGPSKYDIKVNELMRDILNDKDKKTYNATIALARHFMEKDIKNPFGNDLSTGLVYSAVHEKMTNKNLYNVALKAELYDRKCKIVEATYQVLSYDKAENNAVIEILNNSQIMENGAVVWEKSYDEMMSLFNEKYNDHTFHLKEEKNLIDHRYGGGKVIHEKENSIIANFRVGDIEIFKIEINDA